jgi:hypothetical protein
MPEHHLHIISFDIPYPPNYGGVIDVFYKIKTLHALGIKIHLHCIEYPGRDRSPELNKYCVEVHYYPRKTGLRSALSSVPYIVKSRRSEELMQNLLKDDHPILFEGMHTCYYIDDRRLKERFLIYRESNIEHRYYFNLFKVDYNPLKKIYFLFASLKLRMFQRKMAHSSLMLAVSKRDTTYLKKHFPGNKVVHLPSFHANNELNIDEGKGDYVLYHGNIEVPENEYAAKFLVNEVFKGSELRLVIAGMNPPESIKKLAGEHENVELISNPDDEKMFDLIRKAHVNILVTFQATGLKLKLLNTLYNGRFCLVNDEMIKGTAVGTLCEVGNTAEELRDKLNSLFNQSFSSTEARKREEVLKDNYDNFANGRRLVELVF